MSDLGETGFLVLTALAGGNQHGYGMIEEIFTISGGEIRLHAGTLYAVIDRLRAAGFIAVDREEVVQSRLRRYYALTGSGAERLAAESERLQRHARAANQRLRRAGHPANGPVTA